MDRGWDRSDNHGVTDNYWGITVLPITEKTKLPVYRRHKIDENRGRFLQGRITYDDAFIVQFLV